MNSQLTPNNEPLQRAGEAIGRLARDLCYFFRAIVEYAASIYPLEQIKTTAETQNAIKEAPSKVRHLALHSKKFRTRKKNINRALCEYRRKGE